ncbi:MAG: hypothetical protein MMC23_007398 [Stictis urceolatum]|nr:hypothetical protein [Stictis urceolata]
MLPEIHLHPSPRSTILPLLSPQIAALPITRRIQFHLQSPSATILATFPPTTPSLPADYAISYVDRSRAPETECWLFSSIEPSSNAGNALSSDAIQRARLQLLALLAHINDLPLLDSYPSTQNRSLLLVGAVNRTTLSLLKNEPIDPADGKKVISGSTGAVGPDPDSRPLPGHLDANNPLPSTVTKTRIHSSTHPTNKSQQSVVKGHTIPYAKFIFPPHALSTPTTPSTSITSGTATLPTGMHWTPIQPADLKLVLSRTEIPRTERTLEILPSVGVRLSRGPEEGRLIAWAFLGVDGSLSSLHVEEGYRERGLAKGVARRVFGFLGAGVGEVEGRAKGEGDDKGLVGIEGGREYAHSDVARDNVASIGVARALGGVEGWECFWSWVDLGAVEGVVGGL